MKYQLEQRLRSINNEQLVLLFEEVISRHPTLQAEVDRSLTRLMATIDHSTHFDTALNADTVVIHNVFACPPESTPELASYQQRLAQYATRLQQGETPEAIVDDLVNLLQCAEAYADDHHYQQALDIYAEVIDANLTAHETWLLALFDQAMAEFLPCLEMLLIAASSLVIAAPSQPDIHTSTSPPRQVPVAMLPLLTPEVRCNWLNRLFTLWLKYIDRHQTSKPLQQILFEMAWSEDIPCLRNLVEAEIQRISPETPLHSSHCAPQARTTLLENFLKKLPQ